MTGGLGVGDTGVSVLLFVAAVAQIAAAGIALLLIPLSGVRRWWILICAALALQAYRRVRLIPEGTSVSDAVSAFGVSLLILVGVIGIRSVFVSLRETRRLLEEERDRDRGIVNAANALVVVLDEAGRIRDMNQHICEILLCRAEDVHGRDWFDTFVDERVREEVRTGFRQLMSSADANDEYVEYDLTDFEGNAHTCVWHRRVLRDEKGRAAGVRSAGIDLTEQRVLERELELKSVLLDQTNDGVLAYRYDGTIVYANDTACLQRGLPCDEIVGMDIKALMPAEDAAAFDSYLEQMRAGFCVTFEVPVADARGVSRVLESHVCPIEFGGRGLAVDVSRDVTERREAEATIRRLAYTDELTGLSNRVVLYDRAKVAFSRARRDGKRLALLFVDLDDLKVVNDSFGHSVGDELLRAMAERLSEAFRGEDTVARVGGDEFVVLANVEDAEAAAAVADRLEALLSEPYELAEDTIPSSASVGVAVYPEDGGDVDALLVAADASMYAVKEERRAKRA